MSDTITLWVCVDCHLAYHEGEYTPEEDVQPWSLLDLSDGTPTLITRGIFPGLPNTEHSEDCAFRADPDQECTWDGECEHNSFSWTRCDGCGSTLGGDRHAFTQVLTDDER
jgi:hypothetical protein